MTLCIASLYLSRVCLRGLCGTFFSGWGWWQYRQRSPCLQPMREAIRTQGLQVPFSWLGGFAGTATCFSEPPELNSEERREAGEDCPVTEDFTLSSSRWNQEEEDDPEISESASLAPRAPTEDVMGTPWPRCKCFAL